MLYFALKKTGESLKITIQKRQLINLFPNHKMKNILQLKNWYKIN